MAQLAALAVAHALLGAVLALGVWTFGIALARPLAASPLDGYAFGLLAATALAAAVLVHAVVGVAFVLVVVGVGAALGLSAQPRMFSGLGRAFAFALPPVLAFGTILGLLLHGPTAELDSAAGGDMLFYVDRLVSATQSLAPYRDLLVEGESLTYVESAPSFVGAALDPLGIDPVLVHAALFPSFLLTALAIGLGLSRIRPTLVAAGLAAGALTYPSWVTETPPAALALPLTFSLYSHLVRPQPPLVLASVAVVVGIDLLLTKVLGLIPAAVVLGALLLARSERSGRQRAARVVLPLALGAAIAVALLLLLIPWQASLAEAKVLPLDAAREFALDPAAAAPAVTVLAHVVVVFAFAAARLLVPAAAVLASLAGFWFAHRYNFDIAVGMAVLLGALLVAHAPARYERQAPVLAAAGGALLVSAWFRELTGLRAGLVLLVLFVAALIASGGEARRAVRACAAGAAITILALVTADEFRLRPFQATLTRADYDIWHEVQARVPEDGLVFTTLTGPRVLPYEGWHNYPSIAGRQLYIAGWYDGRLVADPEERRRRLRLNDRVVRDGESPSAIPTERAYGSYWLVRAREDSPPPRGRLVYANERFVLHELSASTLR